MEQLAVTRNSLLARKPNVRRLFIPDPGFIICDADVSGADAGVVGWETDDQALKDAFRAGKKIHVETATAFYGDKYLNAPGDNKNKLTPKGKMYDDVKRASHGTNYGAAGRTVAINLGWPVAEGHRFNHLWLKVLHPGVGRWQSKVEADLRTTRTVWNKFGYRNIYHDRVDGLLPEALAWIPQSTVALYTFFGARNVDSLFNPVPRFPRHPSNKVQWLLQVHDSLVFQIHEEHIWLLPHINSALESTIPYADPLVLPWKMTASRKSWGDCVPLETFK